MASRASVLPDNPLLHGPILPKLIGFALPNMGAMVAGSVAAIAETAYVGRLGVPALAGMAVVFPMIMLQDMVARARAAAWIAGGLAAAAKASIGIVLGLFPALWVGMFTKDPATLAAASGYFHWVGPAYGFFGAGMSLFFSALAAGRVVGMLLAGASRLLIVVLGGLVLGPIPGSANAPLWMVYALIATGMVTYGSMAMLVMARAKWGTESTPR